MWEVFLRDSTKQKTCHTRAKAIVDQAAYERGLKERLGDKLALRETMVMQFHMQYRYHLVLCTCHFAEVLEVRNIPKL
jgi:hypothetical protein